MIRSIGVVLLGFVCIGALSFGADALLRSSLPSAFSATGRVDDPGVLLLIQFYVGVFATGGCYLRRDGGGQADAARPGARRARASLQRGGTVRMWETAPAWYHVVALVLVIPYAWLGGRLRERRARTLCAAGRRRRAGIARLSCGRRIHPSLSGRYRWQRLQFR